MWRPLTSSDYYGTSVTIADFQASPSQVHHSLFRRSAVGHPRLDCVNERVVLSVCDVRPFPLSRGWICRKYRRRSGVPALSPAAPASDNFRYAGNYVMLNLRLSFRQFSFQPHAPLFIPVAPVPGSWTPCRAPTCYTPCQVSHSR